MNSNAFHFAANPTAACRWPGTFRSGAASWMGVSFMASDPTDVPLSSFVFLGDELKAALVMTFLVQWQSRSQ